MKNNWIDCDIYCFKNCGEQYALRSRTENKIREETLTSFAYQSLKSGFSFRKWNFRQRNRFFAYWFLKWKKNKQRNVSRNGYYWLAVNYRTAKIILKDFCSVNNLNTLRRQLLWHAFLIKMDRFVMNAFNIKRHYFLPLDYRYIG